MSLDPRIAKKLFQDVTSDRDVSDAVQEHDEDMAEVEIDGAPHQMPIDAIPNLNNEDTIVFRSVDHTQYLINRKAIDWATMAQGMDAMTQNWNAIHTEIENLIYLKTTGGDCQEDIDFVLETVPNLINAFVKPDYDRVYPNLDDHTRAILYCIDFQVLMGILMREVAVFNVSKSLSDLFNIISQEGTLYGTQEIRENPAE